MMKTLCMIAEKNYEKKDKRWRNCLFPACFICFKASSRYRVRQTESEVVWRLEVTLLCPPGVPCSEADYKRWSPSDEHGNECLLGREVTFKRRAPHATCFNGEDFDRPVTISNCSCTRQDYEWWATLNVLPCKHALRMETLMTLLRHKHSYVFSKGALCQHWINDTLTKQLVGSTYKNIVTTCTQFF